MMETRAMSQELKAGLILRTSFQNAINVRQECTSPLSKKSKAVPLHAMEAIGGGGGGGIAPTHSRPRP
jgi:hypothetical protein